VQSNAIAYLILFRDEKQSNPEIEPRMHADKHGFWRIFQHRTRDSIKNSISSVYIGVHPWFKPVLRSLFSYYAMARLCRLDFRGLGAADCTP
jgi:hypothetical protein